MNKTRMPIADATRRLALPCVCLIAATGAALGLGRSPEPQPLRIDVRTGLGVETFELDTTGAKDAPAKRVNFDLVSKRGVMPAPTPGHVLHSVVVARAAQPGPIIAGAKRAGITLEAPPSPIKGTKGFWSVPARTVADGARLADALANAPGVDEAYLDVTRPMELRARRGLLPTDGLFSQQWHLLNNDAGGVDINAAGAWALGYTGDGVTIGITELGFSDHTEFNIDPFASQAGSFTAHGSSVAGIAAARRDGNGTVGVAYNAMLSRQYIGSSATNAAAIGYRNDLNDVKNNSWGPADDGRVRSLASVERDALEQAALVGRDGLGTVLVWAAGNGGQVGDRADYDPYTSSRYTIGVGSVDAFGVAALYTERASSILVCACSDADLASTLDRNIVTTSSNNTYTSTFGGTSASSPEVAGIVALMLEANPTLTWRDVQDILARTARKVDPENATWTTNGAGRDISEYYGYGLVDATAAAQTAQAWTNLAPETTLSSGVVTEMRAIPDNGPAITSTARIDGDLSVESVEAVITVTHADIGDLEIILTSPSGTASVFTTPRNDPTSGLTDRAFTTMRCWGEDARGDWTLSVRDAQAGAAGVLVRWELIAHGVAPAPACPCDWNTDGFLNDQDFFDFLNSYFRDNDADFNDDQFTTDADFFDFVNCFMTRPEACE